MWIVLPFLPQAEVTFKQATAGLLKFHVDSICRYIYLAFG